MNISEIALKAKPSCMDIALEQVTQVGRWDLVQLKWDGWAAFAVLEKEGITVYSRGGVQIDYYLWESPVTANAVLLGEYVGRTAWAGTRPELNKFAVHDVLEIEGEDVSGLVYAERYSRAIDLVGNLNHSMLFMVGCVEITDQLSLNKLWKDLVLDEGFEGLVYKNSHRVVDTFGRTKRWVTKDYVVVDVSEGGGRNAGKLGALVCGLYINGSLKSVVSVGGGFTDSLRELFWNERERVLGKVVEVSGACVFPGGSMRHPNFQRIREDKNPEECVL